MRLVRFVQAEENASQNWRKVGWGGEHASAVDMELRFDKYSQKISEMFQQQSTVITYYSNAFP